MKQHRAVLFDAIGGDEAPHGCQHCGRAVRWSPTDGEQQLVVDHLNHDRADNRPENLVPSCRACNSRRRAGRVEEVPDYIQAWSEKTFGPILALVAQRQAELVDNIDYVEVSGGRGR